MAQRAPTGLGVAGKRLWKSLTDGITYRPDELATLEQAAKTADQVAALEAALLRKPATVPGSKGQDAVNPLIPELRLQRAALVTYLRALNIPEEYGDELTQRQMSRLGGRARAKERHGTS